MVIKAPAVTRKEKRLHVNTSLAMCLHLTHSDDDDEDVMKNSGQVSATEN